MTERSQWAGQGTITSIPAVLQSQNEKRAAKFIIIIILFYLMHEYRSLIGCQPSNLMDRFPSSLSEQTYPYFNRYSFHSHDLPIK